MSYTPIAHGTLNWDSPVNAAFTSQDTRITALEGGQSGGGYVFHVASSVATAAEKAKADYVCTGTNDQWTIQSAMDAAYGSQGGVVQLGPGPFYFSQPLTLQPMVRLQGQHGDQIYNPTQFIPATKIVIQPDFAGGAAIVLLGATAGGYANKSAEQQIRDLTIEGTAQTTPAVHGIQASDYVHGVRLEDVTIRQVSGKGIYTFTENGAQPFSWTFTRVVVDNSGGVGFHLINHTDATLVDCISIGAGSDNYVLSNMPNSRMIGCRAEWADGHGYKIEGNWGTGTGSGGMLFSGCSTDRNHSNGFDITSTGNAPIIIEGCYTRRDGRNNNSGGGGFAGIFAAAATTPLVITGWGQYPGQDDDGAGVNSPQIGGYFHGNACVQLDTSYIHANTTGIDQATNTIYQAGNIVTAVGDASAPVRTATP